MSKYARCNHNDSRYCQGTYRMWKRCTVTNLCDIETESRISTVIAKAIGKAMEKHDEAHDEAVSPLITEAVELTWEEQHHINLLGIIVCLILVIIAITALEIHHMVIYWNKVE
uniref:Uncharacterized protein n=1 Tax=Trichobilharzia regenti TaxID=157069 RepID=A0AA85JX49_TRIRE|nr:unnamed protein product [Trichobilharzia regenti]